MTITELYFIRAENRKTGKREPVSSPMALHKAEDWTPTKWDKASHKYFRIVKYQPV